MNFKTQLNDPHAPLQYINIPKLCKIFGPFTIEEMHTLASIFKPNHLADTVNPKLKAIFESNPKFLTKKLEAQLQIALSKIKQEQSDTSKLQLAGSFKK